MIKKAEIFDHSINPDIHLNFIPYNLKNPDIRVDVAYSVLANRNYELLPEIVAIRESMQDIEKKALKQMETKCKPFQ